MINIPKFIKSIGFALEGIFTLIKSENNARIHLLATLLVILTGFYFKITSLDWYWIILAIAMVWICEAFNTALESLVDLVSPEKHPLAKKVKDLAAAGVLIAAIFAVIVAAKVFLF
jgi:diacylglycerol kinase